MSNYWKSVVSVFTGTAFAQIIPIVGSLLIARLYAPAEFGVFSAWLGAVIVLSVVLTARFENALAIVKDGESRGIAVFATVATSVLLAGLVLASLVICVMVYPEILDRVSLTLFIMSVPTALAVAIAQTWQSWAAAEGSYRYLSMMRIAQAAAITLLQIVGGSFYEEAETLVLAYFMGVVVGLIFSFRIMPLRTVRSDQILGVKEFWREQRRFPQWALPADLINSIAAHLPLLIVANRFGSESAGLLAMTLRILGTPIGLLGKSILDVFKRHAAASFRETGQCRSEYIRTFKALALCSIVFCSIMFLISEPLFVVIFGEAWRTSGIIATWMLPLFALRFVASPLSYVVYIVGKQHIDLLWQLALLVMTLLTLYVANNYEMALRSYSLGYAFLYVVYLMMSYRFSMGLKKYETSSW